MKHPIFLIGTTLFLFCFKLHSAEVRHVYLTWQHNPTRSVTVNLHGIGTKEELTLFYDTAPHKDPSECCNKVIVKGFRKPRLRDGRLLYHIELADLKPHTRYYVSIEGLKDFSFKTLSEEPPYLFVEGGDWENTEVAKELAVCAASFNPDAIFLGGDYPSNVFSTRDYKKWDEWLDAYTSRMVTSDGCLVPIVMAIGNHEVVGGFDQMPSRVPFFLDYFKQGEKSYFTVPVGSKLQLFVLDSGHTHSHEGEQRSWLKRELKKAQEIPIKIAIYHVPIYPSVRFSEKGWLYDFLSFFRKDQKKNIFSYESYKGKKFWLPLFDKFHLTVAFEHHDQALKRTHLLKNDKIDPNGTLYLGDGGWGTKIQYPPIQGLFNSYFACLKGKTHFFWLCQIEKESITYSAISKTGDVLDEYCHKVF